MLDNVGILIMNIRIVSCFLVFSLVAPSAFPVPRKPQAASRPSKALIAVVKETIAAAKTDSVLRERLVAIVGNDTLNQNPVHLDLSKMPLAQLEQVRDALKKNDRLKLIVKEFHNFSDPSPENEKNGASYYAELVKVLTETSNNNDQEAVAFQNDNKEFCKIFSTNANTNAWNLSTCLVRGYNQIKDNDTKNAIKEELSSILSKKGKLGVGLIINRRIKNNVNEE